MGELKKGAGRGGGVHVLLLPWTTRIIVCYLAQRRIFPAVCFAATDCLYTTVLVGGMFTAYVVNRSEGALFGGAEHPTQMNDGQIIYRDGSVYRRRLLHVGSSLVD